MPTPENKLTDLAILSDSTEAATEKVAQTRAAKREKTAYQKYAAEIRRQMDAAHKVEDLVELEMTLQLFDNKFANTKDDETSIRIAVADYAALKETIEQMRRSPTEYFKANLGLKEVGGDFRKQPHSRGAHQIEGNLSRLRNRLSFGAENEIPLWSARTDVACKTKIWLKNLHNELVNTHLKTLTPEELAVLKDRDRAANQSKGRER
ncbi:MAG: hypothetical protein LBP75_02800 [Planctomycetota bacterium]|jgi:hypothetical protein|nr:hypothetical protein [Planctomycetota bacterium]